VDALLPTRGNCIPNARAMLVEIQRLTKCYRAPDGSDSVDVLRDLDLQVEAGESVAITGPSGCGKSTLLNIIGALDHADAGAVRVADRDLSGLDEKALATFRNETIGFIFQLHHLLPQCTILENVLVPTLARADGKSGARERAEKLLDAVGLKHRLDHRPGQLSGGERQRAAVARALINQPKVLLADEPTGALDRVNATRLVDLLVELNKTEGVTLIMVTHAHELAQRMGRVLELADGKLSEHGAK
jgi:ABC-type lipoprotein export system ATPase subunit